MNPRCRCTLIPSDAAAAAAAAVCVTVPATLVAVSDDLRRQIRDRVTCQIPDAMWDLLAGLPEDVLHSRHLFAAVDAYAGLPVGFDVRDAIVARVRREDREKP